LLETTQTTPTKGQQWPLRSTHQARRARQGGRGPSRRESAGEGRPRTGREECTRSRPGAGSSCTHTEKTKSDISEWWNDLGRDWKKQIESIRREVDQDRATHDLKHEQKAAQRADDDAAFAIDYVYAALAEAEYAVLDAYLAHKEADELAQAPSS
jgi:hypothetical protein